MRKQSLWLGGCVLLLALTGCARSASPETVQTETMAETEAAATEAASETETAFAETEAPVSPAATETETENETTTPAEASSETESGTALTEEEATALLLSCFGEADAETGNTYSFGYIANTVVDGQEYLVYDWRWLVDDHMSRLDTLFVAADGSGIFAGLYTETGSTVFTETNYLQS